MMKVKEVPAVVEACASVLGSIHPMLVKGLRSDDLGEEGEVMSVSGEKIQPLGFVRLHLVELM